MMDNTILILTIILFKPFILLFWH